MLAIHFDKVPSIAEAKNQQFERKIIAQIAHSFDSKYSFEKITKYFAIF